jgi:hypothetical protein
LLWLERAFIVVGVVDVWRAGLRSPNRTAISVQPPAETPHSTGFEFK